MDDGPVEPWQPPSTLGAHHEVAVGVYGFAGADEIVPPARGGVKIVLVASQVGVAREGVAYEHGVGGV